MKTLLATLLVFCFSMISAQNYYYVKNIGIDEEEFIYDAPSHKILFFGTDDGENQDEIFTEWQSLPFEWSFYGEPVEGFYVSENGYITFDPDADKVSQNVNTDLPTSSGPDQAIYVFWDDLVVNNAGETPSSTFTDRLFTWTFGTAPNRVHIVMWQNFALKSNDRESYIYGVLAIKEGGDFDILHMNAKNLIDATATVGCQNADGSLHVQVEGSPDYFIEEYLAPGHDDDIAFRFFYGDQLEYDLNMLEHSLPATISQSEMLKVTGELDNLGSTTVNSFELNYTINGGPEIYNEEITGLDIAVGARYEFVHSVPIDDLQAGDLLDIEIWVSMVNGNPDQEEMNNYLNAIVLVDQGIRVDKNVLIEEGTGAWCGYCPNGSYVLSELDSIYNESVIPISYHYSDAMEIPQGREIANTYIGIYPSALIDRNYFEAFEDVAIANPAQWESLMLNSRSQGSAISIDVNAGFSINSERELNYEINALCEDYLYGDLRLTLLLVENNVTGIGTGYDQVNYFSSESSAAGGPSHPYYSYPDPIVGYSHQHVAREWLVDETWGVPFDGIRVYSSGENLSFSDSFLIPDELKIEDLSLVVVASYFDNDQNDRQVLNAIDIPLGDIQVAVSDQEYQNIRVFPNPTSGQLTIDLEETFEAVELLSVKGELVSKLRLDTGTQSWDVSGLDPGTYFLKFSSAKNIKVKRFTKSND